MAYLHYKWTTNADKPPLATVCIKSSPLCTSTSNDYGTEKRRKMEDIKECVEQRALRWQDTHRKEACGSNRHKTEEKKDCTAQTALW
ncbi:epoxyqueuosine reductase [Sesbania bispinosa]|nr:epoxyqueuosine reductase [Sesbania bispinosa]